MAPHPRAKSSAGLETSAPATGLRRPSARPGVEILEGGPLWPVTEEDASVDSSEAQDAPAAEKRPANVIQWNLPFGADGRDSSEASAGPAAQGFSAAPDDTRRRHSNFVRRSSAIVRRSTVAVAQGIQALDPLRPRGNPVDIEVDEIRPISADGFAPWEAFNARRYSTTGPKPSTSSAVASFRKASSAAFVRLGMSEKEDDYIIARLAKQDDIERLPPWKRWVYRLSAPLALAMIGAYWIYFVLRILYTVDAQRQAHQTYWMAWMFIVVEILVVIPNLGHRLWALHAMGLRMRPKLRLLGDNVPSADVIITCCGEDDDLVLDTAKAACNIDYPLARFRVIICDDGKSEVLRKKAELTALEQFDNLYYLSRPKYPGVPHHFKAGNLNYALEETKRLPGGAANFFAALDADMIPEKDWLRALIPHMLINPKCSMTCPPQLFYNVPKEDPLAQTLDTFVHISEPLKDSMGVAWCTGSGYVVRRQALEEIGGFPLGSLAEDVCCSSLLLGAGWDTAFVHEPLQYGTVPDSLASHLKQRTRWTIGTVQTALKLRFSVYGPLVRHMTFPQRLCGFVYTTSTFFTVFLVISMLTCPIVLLAGGNLVPFANYAQLRWLIRALFGSMILTRANEVVAYLPCGYHTGRRDDRAMMWMAIFHAVAIIRTFILPKWLGGKIAVFTSSGSQKAELNERDARLRAPLWRRLKVTIWDCNCYMHLGYILLVVAAVVLATVHNFRDTHTTEDLLIALLTHAAWPPLIWLTCAMSCAVPIIYAIWPPDCPDREDLLDRDPKTGVAYPKEAAKEIEAGVVAWAHEALYSLITLYTTGVFIVSFWIL